MNKRLRKKIQRNDMAARIAALDLVVQHVKPADGDVVLLIGKTAAPHQQVQALRRFLHSLRTEQLVRHGKAVTFVYLEGDVSVHQFRPEDRDAVTRAVWSVEPPVSLERDGI